MVMNISTQVIVHKKKGLKVKVAISSATFPSCCGMLIYTYPSVVPEVSKAHPSYATTIKAARRNKKRVYKAMEELMMQHALGRALIAVSGATVTLTQEGKHSSNGFSMAEFIKVMKWDTSANIPNPVHSGSSSVQLAWKAVYKVSNADLTPSDRTRILYGALRGF